MGCACSTLDHMSRGPGTRQRALLEAVRAAGDGAFIWVVPPDASTSEAAAWRRAARALAKKGQVRAIYLRRLDKRGRNFGHLALTSVDSRLCGDAYPLHSPPWVDPSLGRLWESLGCRMQALVLEDVTGQPVAPCTASRIAREMREASEAAA